MYTILIQIVFYQLLFLVLYEVLLKRDTHYNLQRAYLLFTPIVALLLPYMVLPSLSQGMSETYQVSLPTIFLDGTTTEEASLVVTTKSTLFTLWLLGVGISSLWFLWKFRSLYRLRRTAKIIDKGNHKLAKLPNTDMAFSFWNTIYLGDELGESAREVIYKHEKVHITHRHTLDLLTVHLLRILFWWNPILYLYQNRLEAVHEYIADAEVIEHIPKKEYYQNLLSQVFKTTPINFTNTFYKPSLIKNRILMLQKIKSTRKSKFKYLLAIPLLMFMLVVASCSDTEVVEPDSVIVTENMPMPPPPPPPPPLPPAPPVPFSIIENAPVFPGCEEDADPKACMSSKITEHIAGNFNTNLGNELGLKGIQQINVMFTINTSGELTNIKIRGPHEELEKETSRVIELLPKMIPGEQKGVKVPVTYTLPIRFEIE